MYRQLSNEQQRTQKTSHSPQLFKPSPFLCQCGEAPVVEKGRHPESGKGGYFVVRCVCGKQSIYAKESYKSILDWNTKPISQDVGNLMCPGLNLEGLNMHDALDVISAENSRLKMLITDKDRPQMDSEQWRVLKARYSWCQMLVTVIKRRLKSLNTQPQDIKIGR